MFAKLIDFFKPPEYDSIEQTQRARFLHFALFVSAGACILLGMMNMPGTTALDEFLFIVGGISLLCIPANRRGYYTPVALFFTGLLLALITYSLIAGVGLKDAGLMAYPIFIVLASYLFNKKAVLYTTLLSIGSIVFVYYHGEKGFTPPARYSDKDQLKVILVLLPAVGFLFWVIVDNWEKITRRLRDTYDLTLAGWGQALEFRDHETQGHSQRVVETTIALAKQLGIHRHELDHIRRGALLHDIGKMAIPDAILLKNGGLSDAEWEIVKKHPVHARKMLENIPFLKPALDIPYSHHEWWDGTGYPEGLLKDAIPFAARIFAVVDVWDALISDRPYRPAWPEEKVLDYIRDQSGKQFDPQVVEAFLEFLGKSKN